MAERSRNTFGFLPFLLPPASRSIFLNLIQDYYVSMYYMFIYIYLHVLSLLHANLKTVLTVSEIDSEMYEIYDVSESYYR